MDTLKWFLFYNFIRNRRYSLNDSTDVKIILSESLLLPPQGETNSKSKSPQNTRKLKSSPTKPPLVPNVSLSLLPYLYMYLYY